MKVDHIGYAVRNIDLAAKAFERLGFRVLSEKHADSGRNVFIQFLENNGYIVELVSPTSPSSPITSLLSKVGNSPYHLCYKVAHLDEELQRLKADSYVVLEVPAVAPAMGNKRVAFLVHREIGIVELVEDPAA